MTIWPVDEEKNKDNPVLFETKKNNEVLPETKTIILNRPEVINQLQAGFLDLLRNWKPYQAEAWIALCNAYDYYFKIKGKITPERSYELNQKDCESGQCKIS